MWFTDTCGGKNPHTHKTKVDKAEKQNKQTKQEKETVGECQIIFEDLKPKGDLKCTPSR